jgi:putative PIN family toxin of toxin-antitoxin system
VKLVVDTNVLVSGLIRAAGPPGRVVDLIRVGILTPVVDDRILAEYRDVLRRTDLLKYFSPQDSEAIIDFVEHASHRTAARVIIHDLPDVGDVPFLEAALAEEVPLVTGNLKHFPEDRRRGCLVVDPAEFLRLYFS